MKKLVVLYHPDDRTAANLILAQLRSMLDLDQFELWHRDSRTAFGDAYAQLDGAIAAATAVLAIVGNRGFDDEIENLAQGAIRQRIAEDNQLFGRLRLQLPGSGEPTSMLKRWVSVQMEQPAYQAAAEEVLQRLGIKARLSTRLELDKAAERFSEAARPALRRHLSDVAQALADGKPLTVLVGPYASVEEINNGSCPSRVREELLKLIDDAPLQEMLEPLHRAAATGLIPPLLWQDHLATLCLLSGRSREEVVAAIELAVGSAPGDLGGTPQGLFKAIGDFVQQLGNYGPRRTAGLPAVTILTVCPGLRVERALVSCGLKFERATLLFASTRPEVHRMTYKPSYQQRERARAGEPYFMPDADKPGQADELEFVRLVKLGGSRDLDQGIASGDFGQTYDLLGQLRPLLQDFVAAAGTGPYLVLGGGLGTPPLQAAHAVLLRSALERPERRPRLALVPAQSASPDLLRRIEDGRALRLTKIPNSGLDRLQVVIGDPGEFMDALSIAFGAQIQPRAA